MANPGCRCGGEVVDGIGITADQNQRFSDFMVTGKVQGRQVAGLIVGKLQTSIVRRRPVNSWEKAKAKLLGLIHGYDTVVLESTAPINLECEHDTKIANLLPRDGVAIAFCTVSIIGPIEFDPVNAEHG